MTNDNNSASNRRIARRTLLGVLGSGMATLAGCFGGGESDTLDSEDEDDDESEESTATASAPEDRSQYIESTEIVATDVTTADPELALEVTVVDSYEWDDIDLLTESGENYSTGRFEDGETQTQVPLTEGDDTFEPVPPGEHSLLLEADDVESEVPFTLSTQMDLVGAVAGSSREELEEGSLGLEFDNVGSHADSAALIINDGYEDEYDLSPIPPGETGLVEIDDELRDDTIQCDDNQGVRNVEFTIEFLWSDTLTVSVPIEYSDGTTTPCERSLAGTASVVNGESTET